MELLKMINLALMFLLELAFGIVYAINVMLRYAWGR